MKGRRSGGAGDALARGRAGLAALPLRAQVLAASRMVRRAALAMLEEAPAASREAVVAACDALAASTRREGATREMEERLERAVAVLDAERSLRTSALRQAIRLAGDAARAASAAPADGADAGVTDAALDAVRALEEDGRVTPLQLRILLAADVDQLLFACAGAGVGRPDALPDDVLLRLAPVHAITLIEPRRSAEDDFR